MKKTLLASLFLALATAASANAQAPAGAPRWRRRHLQRRHLLHADHQGWRLPRSQGRPNLVPGDYRQARHSPRPQPSPHPAAAPAALKPAPSMPAPRHQLRPLLLALHQPQQPAPLRCPHPAGNCEERVPQPQPTPKRPHPAAVPALSGSIPRATSTIAPEPPTTAKPKPALTCLKPMPKAKGAHNEGGKPCPAS